MRAQHWVPIAALAVVTLLAQVANGAEPDVSALNADLSRRYHATHYSHWCLKKWYKLGCCCEGYHGLSHDEEGRVAHTYYAEPWNAKCRELTDQNARCPPVEADRDSHAAALEEHDTQKKRAATAIGAAATAAADRAAKETDEEATKAQAKAAAALNNKAQSRLSATTTEHKVAENAFVREKQQSEERMLRMARRHAAEKEAGEAWRDAAESNAFNVEGVARTAVRNAYGVAKEYSAENLRTQDQDVIVSMVARPDGGASTQYRSRRGLSVASAWFAAVDYAVGTVLGGLFVLLCTAWVSEFAQC